MNKKGLFGVSTVLLILGSLVAIFSLVSCNSYNSFQRLDSEVSEKWSNVETIYQKRANLIPNLERAVKSYAKFEKGTLVEVVEARSKATSINLDPKNMTAQDMERFQAAQGQLSGALSRLMVVVEKYPELKADLQYSNFQREYIAIENSIRAETVNYNAAVKDYNNAIRTFPNNVLAKIMNFHEKPYYKAEAGAKNAPDVFKED